MGLSKYNCGMKPKKRGPGRPKKGPTVRMSVDIKPEIRAKVDELMIKNSWTLNVTVEKIIEGYFAQQNQSQS